MNALSHATSRFLPPKYHNTSHFAQYAYSNQGRDHEVGDDVCLENIWEPWQFEVTNVDLTTFP